MVSWMFPRLDCMRKYPECSCSFIGKKADLSMLVAHERVVKTSPCSSALFWTETLNIWLQVCLVHSMLMITRWQSATFSASFFVFVGKSKGNCVWVRIRLWRLKRGCLPAYTGCHREPWGSPTSSPLFRQGIWINHLQKALLHLLELVYQKSHKLDDY